MARARENEARAPIRVVVLCLSLVACGGPPPLFRSTVDYAPLAVRLREAGESASEIVLVHRVSDLARFQSNERYKLVVRQDGTLAVAPLPASAEHNEYLHPVLAGDGAPVRTAGGLTVRRGAQGTVTRIDLDAESHAYPSTPASLGEAVDALVRAGVARAIIRP